MPGNMVACQQASPGYRTPCMRMRTKRWPAISLLSGAVLALILFGIVGVGRQGVFNFDGSVLYAAGVPWLAHGNPYDHAQLTAAVQGIPNLDMAALGFFYPPQAAAICIALGAVPYKVSEVLWLLANLVAIGTIVWVVVRTHSGGWAPSIPAALVVGNPFTLHVVWMGQTSLVAFAATAAAWSLSEKRRWLMAGLCLGLASFKPQISVAVFLWFLLDRNWRLIGVSGITATAMAAVPLLQQGGPVGALKAWSVGLQAGYGLPFNLPSFSHKIGMQSLIFEISGFSMPSVILTGICIALTVFIWRNRYQYDSVTSLALLMIVTSTFSVYLHDYDYVALIPAFVAMWQFACRSSVGMVLTVLLIGLLFIPQRLMHAGDWGLVYQWRSLVVVTMGVLLAYAMRIHGRSGEMQAVQNGC